MEHGSKARSDSLQIPWTLHTTKLPPQNDRVRGHLWCYFRKGREEGREGAELCALCIRVRAWVVLFPHEQAHLSSDGSFYVWTWLGHSRQILGQT